MTQNAAAPDAAGGIVSPYSESWHSNIALELWGHLANRR
jgi:hypothetical protein